MIHAASAVHTLDAAVASVDEAIAREVLSELIADIVADPLVALPQATGADPTTADEPISATGIIKGPTFADIHPDGSILAASKGSSTKPHGSTAINSGLPPPRPIDADLALHSISEPMADEGCRDFAARIIESTVLHLIRSAVEGVEGGVELGTGAAASLQHNDSEVEGYESDSDGESQANQEEYDDAGPVYTAGSDL
jgi:hypothetical protein